MTIPARLVLSDSRLAKTADGTAFELESSLHRKQRVLMSRGLLSPGNPTLSEALRGRRALVVLSPSVHRIYGGSITRYFAAQPGTPPAEFMILDCSEASKSLDGAAAICERATAVGLRRTSPIVAIGGGVCCDISGLAAALHRRGVPHIKVPTTLIGLVDAGIGTKNAVNHSGRKSALGSFYPPEHSLLDPAFLHSLPRRQLINGLAEVVKMAVVTDPELFSLLTRDAVALVESGFRTPEQSAARLVSLSVADMLGELTLNLYEHVEYRRKADFGHTFSPFFEVARGYSVLHGEAVAMDIALSAQIASVLGLLPETDLERILFLMESIGLPLAWPRLSADAVWNSLAGIIDHRDGDLHLVVPTAIGDCDYLGIETITPRLIEACVARLVRRSRGCGGRLDVRMAAYGTASVR